MSTFGRRDFLKLSAFFALLSAEALAGHRRRRRRHRRRRRRRSRRIRRRMRRRVSWRAVGKRKVVVAPAAPRVGMELAVAGQSPGTADEVVVVKEVKPDVLVVAGPDGKLRDLEYVKEDTPENTRELQGSVVPDGEIGDGPYVESDITEWEEFDR